MDRRKFLTTSGTSIAAVGAARALPESVLLSDGKPAINTANKITYPYNLTENILGGPLFQPRMLHAPNTGFTEYIYEKGINWRKDITRCCAYKFYKTELNIHSMRYYYDQEGFKIPITEKIYKMKVILITWYNPEEFHPFPAYSVLRYKDYVYPYRIITSNGSHIEIPLTIGKEDRWSLYT